MKRFMNIKLDHKEVSEYRWVHYNDLDKIHTNVDLQHIRKHL